MFGSARLQFCNWRPACRAAILAAVLVTAACVSTEHSSRGVIQPSYVFSLGSTKNDVFGMLGPPQKGPRFDRFSTLTEAVYVFPFPAVRAETRLRDGTIRVELVDTIHFFFNQKNLIERMAFRTDRNYPSFTDLPVHKITVLPRLVDTQGRVRPVPTDALSAAPVPRRQAAG